jgi:hypothetical protein
VARIALPVRMTADESYLVLRATDQIEKEPGPVEVDASACEWFSPLGTTLLALAIARRVSERGDAPTFIPPAAREGREFLSEIGFDRYLDGHGADRLADQGSGTLEMRQLSALGVHPPDRGSASRAGSRND